MRSLAVPHVTFQDSSRTLGPFDDFNAAVRALGAPTLETEAAAADAYRILTAHYLPAGPGERPRVYGVSPLAARQGYTMTDHEVLARRFAAWIWQQGGFPVFAHLYLPQFLDDRVPAQRAEALALGLSWLARCDRVAVLDIPPSSGMAGEIQEAERLHIPVQHVPWECLGLPPYAAVDQVRLHLFDAHAPI